MIYYYKITRIRVTLVQTKKQLSGHLLAGFTVLVWGSTFIFTKLLLEVFTPFEILLYRFVLAYIVLWLVRPKPLFIKNKKLEWMFAGAGLCGVTLYYLLENIALTYSTASNVGIIVSTAPFFTALLARKFLAGEKQRPQFFVGMVVALAGIVLISYNGSSVLELNPLGDLLAVIAAVVWAFYSILVKRLSAYHFDSIQMTRRIFMYGILLMLPVSLFMPFQFNISTIMQPRNLVSILFLGIIASAGGFVTWNITVHRLGAVKSSVYIYLIPVITLVAAAIILHEPITGLMIGGTALILIGLVLSEIDLFTRKSKVVEYAEEDEK